MLPSTGYFKTINCPFYDSGLCERPYCHFRHVRKEATETQVASSAATSKEEKSQDESPADHPTDESLNKLVSEAVKRVLQQQQEIMTGSVTAPTSEAVVPDSIVNKVVAELKPTIAQRVPPLAEASTAKSAHKAYLPPAGIPQYKPTPISELKKRHIPVPYTPLPAPRGTSKVQVKHPSSKDDIARRKFKSETIVKDPNRERTDSHDSEELPAKKPSYLYSPSPIATSSHNGWGAANKSVSYIPSSIDGLPTRNSDYVPSSLALSYSIPEYCPSEKCGSSTEPQYYPFDKSNSTCTVEANYVPGKSESDHIDIEYKPGGSSETGEMGVEYKPTVKTELVEESNSNDKTNFTGLEDIDLSLEFNILEKILDENSNESNNVSLDTKSETENKKIESSKLLETLPESEMERIHDPESVETTNKVKVESETKIKPKGSSSHSKSHTRPSSSSSKKKEREKKLEKSKTSKHSKGNDKNSKKDHENKHSVLKNERVKASSSSCIKDGSEKKSNVRHSSHRHRSSSNISEHSHEHSSSDADTVTKDKQSHSSSSTKKSHRERSRSSLKSHRERSRSSSKSHRERSCSCSKSHRERSRSCSKSHRERSCSCSKSHRERSRSSSKSHRERSRSSSGANKSQDRNHHNHHKGSGHDNSRKDRKLQSKSSTKSSKERKSKKQVHRSPSPTSDSDDSGQPDSSASLSTVCEESETEVIPADSPEPVISDSDPDEDTITEECYRIFQEYEPQPKPPPMKKLKLEETVKEEDVVLPRRRIAHEGAQYHPPQIAAAPKHIPNPIQTMHARIARLRAMNERKLDGECSASTSHMTNVSALSSCVSSNSGASNSTGRVRIAHVPNVKMILNAKSKMEEYLQRRNQDLAKNNTNPKETTENEYDCKTVVQTVPKGTQRIIRKPHITVLKQTTLLGDYGGNVPVALRQVYCHRLTTEYERLYHDSEEEASKKAKEEELLICERSTTRSAYTSNMSNLIGRLRKEAQQGATPSNVAHPQMGRTVSHSAILAGPSGSKGRGSWSIVRHNKTNNESAENTFYSQMLQFLMTEDQLINNGYPMPHPEEKGMAIIKVQKAYMKKQPLNSLQRKVMRNCCRCDATYSVDKHGFQLKEEPCVFHWGKIFHQRVRGMWDRRYMCCSADFGAEGCTVNSYHVHDDTDPENLKGFVKTLPSLFEPPNGDYGVFALDCEMSYTTHGVELTRVTVIDKDLNTVYETLVKPANPIIDYNTRYSGITKEMMKDVKTTIYEVQASLLALFHEKTILLGHSLENDLKALKIIHNMVVDTSIVFPHKQGPPKKRALKNLCRDYLHKLIQEGEDGHDSAEDARACMELMKWRLNMT